MAIQKQEFYEGAAIYQLLRSAGPQLITFELPFLLVAGGPILYIKHSTQKRSPWGFTLTTEERRSIKARTAGQIAWIGLVCGSDGIAGITYQELVTLLLPGEGVSRIACRRLHREQYQVSGPAGELPHKVPPSRWPYLLKTSRSHGGSPTQG